MIYGLAIGFILGFIIGYSFLKIAIIRGMEDGTLFMFTKGRWYPYNPRRND